MLIIKLIWNVSYEDMIILLFLHMYNAVFPYINNNDDENNMNNNYILVVTLGKPPYLLLRYCSVTRSFIDCYVVRRDIGHHRLCTDIYHMYVYN